MCRQTAFEDFHDLEQRGHLTEQEKRFEDMFIGTRFNSALLFKGPYYSL